MHRLKELLYLRFYNKHNSWNYTPIKTFPVGSKEDIFQEVKDRVSNIGSRAGLILGSSNTLGKDVPVENIRYFAEACKKYCE